MRESCKNFLELIKKEKFYEAHEVLEEVWFPFRKERDSKTLVLKGFINASVAFELNRLKRAENAKKAWKNFEKYRGLIKECNEPIFYEIEKVLDRYYDKYLS